MEQRLAFIGDVHGCYAELMDLVDAIGFFEGKVDKMIFVGDLIDKGPHPELVINWCKQFATSCVFVKGNHEEKHLRYNMHERKVRKNPNYKNPMGFTDDQLRTREALLGLNYDAYHFIDSWNDYHYCLDAGNHLVLHGGLLPGMKAEDMPTKIITRVRYLKSDKEMAHIDEITAEMPFWTEKYHGPEKVIFGHQPFPTPHISEHAIGIDTGCVHGNYLTAYLPHLEEKFVQVKAAKVYSTLRVTSPGQLNTSWDE